jgi:ABC-2 type transport system permease protein
MNHLAETPLANHIFESFLNLNLPMIIFGFVFYFIGGYLTYAALFAAIGSAVDNETDTQQFILPISMPMILSFVVASQIMRDPDGSLAFWLSIIPFTSPIAMIVRLPQNPPMWQLALSMVLLVVSFIGTTWMASKIYRVGILMYGKKTTYKELWKWMWYKV